MKEHSSVPSKYPFSGILRHWTVFLGEYFLSLFLQDPHPQRLGMPDAYVPSGDSEGT
ncbi:MAG: hypothetical protein ACK4YV_03920 [Emticicia sp.]